MNHKLYADARNIVEVSEDISRPKHYRIKGLEPYESIDIIKANLGKTGFNNFCLGNVFKYLIRHKNKNGLEDLKKARVYLDWMIKNWEWRDDEKRA